MNGAPVDTFESVVERVDVTMEGDEIWSDEIQKEMTEAGFSMKGAVCHAYPQSPYL